MDELIAFNPNGSRNYSPPITPLHIGDYESLVDALRDQPDFATFQAAIQYLDQAHNSFDITIPSPRTTSVLQILVQDVIPNYWRTLTDSPALTLLFDQVISCLTSLPAVSAITARLRAVAEAQTTTFVKSQTACLITLLERILVGRTFIGAAWRNIESSDASNAQKALFCTELVNLVSGGQIISTVAQVLKHNQRLTLHDSWIANGSWYCQWLVDNLVMLPPQHCSRIIIKALSMGYTGVITTQLAQTLGAVRFIDVITSMDFVSLKTITTQLIDLINRNHPKVEHIPNIVSLFVDIGTKAPNSIDFIIDMLTNPKLQPNKTTIVTIRGLLAAVVILDPEKGQQVLDKTFASFDDDIFIKHTDIIQQENCIQALLLAAGHVYRTSPLVLKIQFRSTQFHTGLSKHLKGNQSRVRWLGMVTGNALSQLVNNENIFEEIPEVDGSSNSNWYFDLSSIQDYPAETLDLQALLRPNPVNPPPPTQTSNPVNPPPTQPRVVAPKKKQPAPKIQVLSEDDSDLNFYPKPDSDPEDEDEDPTLINRDKARPPVYIRDLLTGLRETENYDKHEIALQTAASLIRRKTGFGKEVSDHSEELAAALMNLNDAFELPGFETLRNEALIAIILSDPSNMAPLVTAHLFDADLSLQQRTSILTALGLSARELAGFKDASNMSQDSSAQSSFPSKLLPPALHAIYATEEPTRFTSIASSLQASSLLPIAIDAANKDTGPNALSLKLNPMTSSRLTSPRTKPTATPNKLAQIVANAFFFPLTHRWNIAVGPTVSSGSNRSHTVWKSGLILPTYLRTLSLLLHSAGPHTLALPQLTGEAWDLFLSCRFIALNSSNNNLIAAEKRTRELGVIEAVLFGIMTLVDLNDDENLAREWPREIMESLEWAKMVLDQVAHTAQGSDEQENQVRRLAAGVIVRCGEIAERWGRIMGVVSMTE